MTHKFGRIERRIRGIVASEPPNAFTVRELCERIYEVPPEKKHRVAVLRAMKTLSGCWPHMGLITRPGVGAVIYDQRSEVSHRMALAKLEAQISSVGCESGKNGKVVGLYSPPVNALELEEQLGQEPGLKQ